MSKLALFDTILGLRNDIGESFSSGITLFIGGIIISGDLIHPIAYYRLVADVLESSQGDSTSMIISSRLSQSIREGVESAKGELKSRTDSYSINKIDEIYLKNVKILRPPNDIVYNNAALALRIDAIDGFIWGR